MAMAVATAAQVVVEAELDPDLNPDLSDRSVSSTTHRDHDKHVVKSPIGTPQGTPKGTPQVLRKHYPRRFGRGRTHSNLKLNGSSVSDIGTSREVLEAAKHAREELAPFVDTEPPPMSVLGALKFGIVVFNWRFLAEWCPFGLIPFTRRIVSLGGVERVHLLIVIARFDINQDGQISESEYAIAQQMGEKAVAMGIQGCANFAIISALLFGATHLTTIGRPKPFAPDEESIDDFGETATKTTIWVAYALNVCAQSLALGIIVTSIYIRQLLCNSLPSTISKLVLLSDTNVLSNLATACTWMLACLVWMVTIGGFLSVPTYGFLSVMIVPILAIMLIPTVYPAILKTAIRLRLEAQSVITSPENRDDPVTKAPPAALVKEPTVPLDQGEADGVEVDSGL